MANADERFEYDVFISHASEDKDIFVRPFASKLSDVGVRVWYDEFSLNLGDSLSSAIDKGLTKSRFGIIVISPAFIRKNWTDYELRGLIARQVEERKVIIPIWHDVDKATVLRFSPTLADIVAINTNEGIGRTTLKVIRQVRPDIFGTIEAKFKFDQIVANATPELRRLSELKRGRRLRDRLSDGQMRRIRIIHTLLREVNSLSFERSYDSFLRDVPVEDEIQKWEWLALVVSTYKLLTECNVEEATEVFRLLLLVDLRKLTELTMEQRKKLVADGEQAGINMQLLLDTISNTNQHPILEDDEYNDLG